MNKREKKLLYATGAILVLGVSTLLMGDGDPPKKGRSPVAHASAPTPSSVGVGDEGSWLVSSDQLFRFLRREAQPWLPSTRNPFVPLSSRPPPQTKVENPKPPELVARTSLIVTGVFISGSTRGALVSGEIWFVGEEYGEYHLLEVHADRVRIAVGDEEWEIKVQSIEEESLR